MKFNNKILVPLVETCDTQRYSNFNMCNAECTTCNRISAPSWLPNDLKFQVCILHMIVLVGREVDYVANSPIPIKRKRLIAMLLLT